MKRVTLTIALVAAAALLSLTAGEAAAQPTWEVEITNLTHAQIFSHPMAVSHANWRRMFRVGEPASQLLIPLAEDGDNSSFFFYFATARGIIDSDQAGTPLMPGHTVTLTVQAESYHRITVLGMLVTTNDAFFGLNAAVPPMEEGVSTVYVPAYDAGSEANNEQCAFIPGPPCNSMGVRDTAEAEGFIHIHRGFQGVGDLERPTWDWRNPVARIVIRRQ
jgi:hypothetical protein